MTKEVWRQEYCGICHLRFFHGEHGRLIRGSESQFHEECLACTPTSTARKIATALQYSYEPSGFDQLRRLEWAYSQCAQGLSLSFSGVTRDRVPFEVWHNIAQYLPRQYLSAAVIAQWTTSFTSPCMAQTSLPFKCNYIRLEGETYVSSITNESEQNTVLDPRVNTIAVAENYAGITQILFLNSSECSSIQPSHGIWWRTLPFFHNSAIIGESDVSPTPRDGYMRLII